MPRLRIAFLFLVATTGVACADQPTAPTSRLTRTSKPSLSVSGQGNALTGTVSYPYAILFDVPCARGGTGDLVQATGEIVDHWHIAMTPTGSWLEGDIAVAHHGQAGSLIDGTVYEAPLTNHVTNNIVAGQSVGSNTMQFRFVGPGPGNNLVVSSLSVWNFDGNDVHVWFSDFTITCGTDGSNVPGSNQGANPIHDWPSN